MHDVLIIGGGLVGSHVAYKLAGMGHRVVVLERKKKLGESVCCTGIISQECVSSFAIDASAILREANSAKLFPPLGEPVIWLWREKTQACIVDRAAFDMSIARRAQDNGAEYVLNTRVSDIKVGDDGVIVEAVCRGRGLSFEARAAVIAAGFGSRLVEKLGLGKTGYFVVGAQAEVEPIELDEIELYFGQEIAPGFYAWLVPTSPGRALVGLGTRHRPGLYLRNLMSSLLAQGKIASDEVKPDYRVIPLKPLAKTYSNRLVVVGDAAGQVKPTTGGGVYFGLLCADIASNTLHRALETNDLSARSLSNYERDWHRKLGRELAINYYARKFYQRLSDRQIDRIFNIIKSNSIDEALLKAGDLSFDRHGEVVLRLLGHRAMSKFIKAMKSPFGA